MTQAPDTQIESFEILKEGNGDPISVEGETRFCKESEVKLVTSYNKQLKDWIQSFLDHHDNTYDGEPMTPEEYERLQRARVLVGPSKKPKAPK